MKLKNIRDDYYAFSAKVSDIARQLCYAGIAVIWALRLGKGAEVGLEFNHAFLLPLVMFVISLLFDLFHYVWATLATGVINHKNWKKFKDNEKDIIFPNWINNITIALFSLKIFLIIIAQLILTSQLWCLLTK